MDDFDFSLYQDIGTPGKDYIKKYDIVLPPRIYNAIKNINFTNSDDFYGYLTNLLDRHTSQSLFPGDICFFHPNLRNPKASRLTICCLSGAEIDKGESYCTYRPLLENITRGNTYTIQQTLKVANGYENILPNDLHSFEVFYEYFQSTVDYSGISMYDMKVNAGDDALNLKLLSKRKHV